MVSSFTLAICHLRLQQIFNNQKEYFGGINLIVLGDFMQVINI